MYWLFVPSFVSAASIVTSPERSMTASGPMIACVLAFEANSSHHKYLNASARVNGVAQRMFVRGLFSVVFVDEGLRPWMLQTAAGFSRNSHSRPTTNDAK